ncbi:MAG: UPF0179 family protein [Thermoplasmatales archaeon]
MIITLVPSSLNASGKVFQYIGPAPECNVCNLKNVCHNLKPGELYVVVKSREKEHKCYIHEDNKVFTVEVDEMERSLMIPKTIAKEGAKVTYKKPDCDDFDCPLAEICILSFAKDRSKIKIEKLLSRKCPRGLGLVEASIQ